jgi:hypothetical protein
VALEEFFSGVSNVVVNVAVGVDNVVGAIVDAVNIVAVV